MVLRDLAVSWFRIGVVGFGGGPAMIPLMRDECVERRGWMTDEQFLDAIGVQYALPGPITAKMSAHVGLLVGGPLGAVVAPLCVVAPAALLMLGLGAVMARYRDNPVMIGALAAVKPVALGLLAWTVISLAPEGLRDWRAGLIAVASAAALAVKVPPALVIVAGLAVGALALR